MDYSAIIAPQTQEPLGAGGQMRPTPAVPQMAGAFGQAPAPAVAPPGNMQFLQRVLAAAAQQQHQQHQHHQQQQQQHQKQQQSAQGQQQQQQLSLAAGKPQPSTDVSAPPASGGVSVPPHQPQAQSGGQQAGGPAQPTVTNAPRLAAFDSGPTPASLAMDLLQPQQQTHQDTAPQRSPASTQSQTRTATSIQQCTVTHPKPTPVKPQQTAANKPPERRQPTPQAAHQAMASHMHNAVGMQQNAVLLAAAAAAAAQQQQAHRPPAPSPVASVGATFLPFSAPMGMPTSTLAQSLGPIFSMATQPANTLHMTVPSMLYQQPVASLAPAAGLINSLAASAGQQSAATALAAVRFQQFLEQHQQLPTGGTQLPMQSMLGDPTRLIRPPAPIQQSLPPPVAAGPPPPPPPSGTIYAAGLPAPQLDHQPFQQQAHEAAYAQRNQQTNACVGVGVGDGAPSDETAGRVDTGSQPMHRSKQFNKGKPIQMRLKPLSNKTGWQKAPAGRAKDAGNDGQSASNGSDDLAKKIGAAVLELTSGQRAAPGALAGLNPAVARQLVDQVRRRTDIQTQRVAKAVHKHQQQAKRSRWDSGEANERGERPRGDRQQRNQSSVGRPQAYGKPMDADERKLGPRGPAAGSSGWSSHASAAAKDFDARQLYHGRVSPPPAGRPSAVGLQMNYASAPEMADNMLAGQPGFDSVGGQFDGGFEDPMASDDPATQELLAQMLEAQQRLLQEQEERQTQQQARRRSSSRHRKPAKARHQRDVDRFSRDARPSRSSPDYTRGAHRDAGKNVPSKGKHYTEKDRHRHRDSRDRRRY